MRIRYTDRVGTASRASSDMSTAAAPRNERRETSATPASCALAAVEIRIAADNVVRDLDTNQLDVAIRYTSRQSAGTGLGLPLTKALVEANRANFSIDSAVDQGTMVKITFPTNRVLAG